MAAAWWHWAGKKAAGDGSGRVGGEPERRRLSEVARVVSYEG